MEPDLPEIDSGDEDLVLVGCNGACKGRSFPIKSLPCSIGRAPGNDLPLAGDGTASGRHCRIDRVDGRLWIEDAGSKNGTYHNGARISGREELSPGASVICAGRTRFMLLSSSANRDIGGSGRTQSIMVAGSVIVPGVSRLEHAAPEALLVLDLCDSTSLSLEHGESAVCRCVTILEEVLEAGPAGPGLLFLKCTGDGFFATFPDASSALAAACSVLDWIESHADRLALPDVAVRVGLHWGPVRTDPDGDRVGLAANMVFRLQAARREDRVQSAPGAPALPARNRILLTGDAAARLAPAERAGALPMGRFLFKGFSTPIEVCLWARCPG